MDNYRNLLIENNKIIYGLIDEVKKLKNIGGDNDNNKINYDFNLLKSICFVLGVIGFLLICYIMRKKEKRDDK